MEGLVNYHSMMKEYKQVDLETKLVKDDKHNFIKLVLEEIINNLKSLSYCINAEKPDLKVKSRCFSQILCGIMVLQSSLDFENGEPIASNLFNLYDYCRKEVIANYRKNTSDGIASSILVLEDILDAWKQIN